MASICNLRCSSRRLLIGAEAQRTLFSSSRLCLTIVLLFSSVAMLSKDLPLAVLEALATEEKSNCTPPVEGVRTKCTCESSAKAPDLQATISEETNELEIHCKGGLNYAPDGLVSSNVCSADADAVCACQVTGHKSVCIDVNSLLLATSTPAKWEPVTEGRTNDKPKALIIPKDKLPHVDGEFLVGCSDSGSTTKCKVAVTVAARATETKDQQVTCSYGKDSNKKHQTITLSPSQNSFTLVCGEKGEIVQTNYKKTYCDVSEENAAVKDCHGKYRDILPGYEEGWWTDGEEKSFTFTIPEDKFPTARAKMMVQCQIAEEKHVKALAPAAPEPSVCSVDVSIEGDGSASAASMPVVSGLLNRLVLASSGVMASSIHSFLQ
ncbi:SAG-related sequence [Besnoitia besnoiti]|uniref:SAG-related sequence n=1 Tax=Besnoitia besnoiti TaxID=94643 RepID=A0A2A9MFV1_BESBE|nr:SAG-related sequence [Besnoitia besnoiti]PFH36809.1 SAG-related sequence [Besnoitia besnoiti]